MSRGSFGSSFGHNADEGFSSYHNSGRDVQGEYHRLTTQISTNIQKITNNVSQVQRMSNQIGTPQDSEKLREELYGCFFSLHFNLISIISHLVDIILCDIVKDLFYIGINREVNYLY